MGQGERLVDTKVTKEEVQQRVSQGGKPLALSKFALDAGTNTFSTVESELVIDFSGISNFTFKTGHKCTFSTEFNCTFDTGDDCIFKTGGDCTFNTGRGCSFDTGSTCTFNADGNCIFRTVDNCTFNTGYGCTFIAGMNCTFHTRGVCTFSTGDGCTFTTYSDCTFLAGSGCTWVIEGKSYPFAPLLFQGSQWPVNVYQPGYLKIGCQTHTFPTWDRDVGKIARKHNASPEVLAEYLDLISVAKVWAEKKGWLNCVE